MRPLEQFARDLPPATTDAVRAASQAKITARRDRLQDVFDDLEAARTRAAEIKDEVLDNLDTYLRQFIAQAELHGIRVHHAADAAEARALILGLLGPQEVIVKGKSMATEEIHLNEALAEAGHEVVETDLGEFVVQLDGDTPSHIVTPIIHKTRHQVADSFAKAGLGPYSDDPATLTAQGRAHLRTVYARATVGISGVNFAIAETGRLVIVENEGNNGLATTLPAKHIAVMGLEKLLAREADLPLFLRLLAGSATGQRLTTYTHLLRGPRQPDEDGGPDELHLILLDNGRRRILESEFRTALRCIRCGACLNGCPVYRQVSGHGYGHVYSGPIGAVLAPLLDPTMTHLPSASSLCGVCEEVCPVKIPIPDLLLRHRSQNPPTGPTWPAYRAAASQPGPWRAALKMLPLAGASPVHQGWTEFHKMPMRQGRDFRNWWPSHRPAERVTSNRPEQPSAPAPNVERSQPDFEARLQELGAEIGEPQGNSTQAILGIAETGSLLIAATAGRRTNLWSEVHHVEVTEVVTTLEEAFARLPEGNAMLVTGPSRTADIEGVIVRGVHGPLRLVVSRRVP